MYCTAGIGRGAREWSMVVQPHGFLRIVDHLPLSDLGTARENRTRTK